MKKKKKPMKKEEKKKKNMGRNRLEVGTSGSEKMNRSDLRGQVEGRK